MVGRVISIVVGVALIAGPSLADGVPTVEIDHLNSGRDFATKIEVQPGQYFDCVLRHSTKSFYIKTYAFAAATSSAGRGPAGTQAISSFKELVASAHAEEIQSESTVVSVPHRPSYGGYVIEIGGPASVKGFQPNPQLSSKQLESVAAAFVERLNNASWDTQTTEDSATVVLESLGSLHDLKPIKVFVSVQSPENHVAFGGGFAVSWLVDERFKAEDVGGRPVLRRDRKAESRVRPLAVAFIHVLPVPTGPIAVSLGLGVNGDSDLAIFPGLSYRIGNVLFVTTGVHVGSILTKPVGTTVDAPIEDISVLTKPDRRYETKAFISCTYTFLGRAQEAFSKPFAEADHK